MPPILPLLPPDGSWTALGLMSGTSADGIDAVLVQVDAQEFRGGKPFRGLLGHHHLPYPESVQREVLAAAADRLPPSQLCLLQRRLGELNAEAASALCEETGFKPDLAALHGQTVQHQPQGGATLQLADPYVLVERLGCPIVWDLRRRDLALGGQGAPLVPLTELWLQGQADPWVALNLGGIANATVWDGHGIRAWDLGPAMSLLDLAAQRWLGLPFDPEGAGATGPVDEAQLGTWLEHPYFHQPPPKSTGREAFGQAWLEHHAGALEALSLDIRLATLAAFSAEAIRRELATWGPPLPPRTPLRLSGGGSRHRRLLRELSGRMPAFQLEEDLGFPQGAREAVSWALLGCASALGLPGNLPEVTGAREGRALGSWVFPVGPG